MQRLSYLDQFSLVTERANNRPMECVLVVAKGKGKYPVKKLEKLIKEKLTAYQVGNAFADVLTLKCSQDFAHESAKILITLFPWMIHGVLHNIFSCTIYQEMEQMTSIC
jgi:hypothetical protein